MKNQQGQTRQQFKLAYGGRDLTLLNFLEDKISHDATSPLFAMLAYFYLDVGKIAEAISVAQRGVITYKDYSTGHVVLGMALKRAGFFSEAKREILLAKELRPNSQLISKLLAELEKEERAETIGIKLAEEFLSKKGIMEEVAEVIRNKSTEKSQDDLLIPGMEVLIGDKHGKERGFIPDHLLKKDLESYMNDGQEKVHRKEDIDISLLARELESAKPLNPVRDSQEDQGEGLVLSPEIVTETIAKIFEEQGNIETALEAYRLLVIKKPDRALFYNAKISELKEKLGGQSE